MFHAISAPAHQVKNSIVTAQTNALVMFEELIVITSFWVPNPH